MTLDEVIDKLIECHTRWARWSETSDIVERDAVEGAIQYLQEYREVSRDGLVADGMNEMLYPCPDCGGIAKIEVSEAYRDDVRVVHSFRAVCGGCGGSGAASFDQTEAVIHWNESAAEKIKAG